MNKIGTAHVLLSDSVHTLPIEEENDGRGSLCESWSAMGVSSFVHDGGTSALGVGFREADPGPWKTMLRRGSGYDDDDGPAPVRRMRSSMRQMRCGGRVRRCKGDEHEGCVPWRSLFCGGDRKWGVSRCTILGAGWGWLGMVNLKL